MSKIATSTGLSKCCKSEMRVVGGDEGTMYYECLNCGNPCDIWSENNDDWKKRFREKFIGPFEENPPWFPKKSEEAVYDFIDAEIRKGKEEEREHIIYVFEHIEENATRERILEYIKKLSTKEIITSDGEHTGVFVTSDELK